MTLSDAISARIMNPCRENNISLNKLATICGITQSTLNNIVCGKSKKPTVSTIKKICDGLEMSLADFFDCREFYALDQEIK